MEGGGRSATPKFAFQGAADAVGRNRNGVETVAICSLSVRMRKCTIIDKDERDECLQH